MKELLVKLEENHEIIWLSHRGLKLYVLAKEHEQPYYQFYVISKEIKYLHSFEKYLTLEDFTKHVNLALQTHDFNYNEGD